MAGLNQSRIRS